MTSPADWAAQLASLDAAATEGPWSAVINDLIGGITIATRDAPASQINTRSESPDRFIGDFMGPHEAALIVWLRNHTADFLAMAERLATAEADADRLAKFGYVDDDQCRLDHDGDCQTHFGGNPCSVAGRIWALRLHDEALARRETT